MSQSISKTRFPETASAFANASDDVDLPSPGRVLVTEMTFGKPCVVANAKRVRRDIYASLSADFRSWIIATVSKSSVPESGIVPSNERPNCLSTSPESLNDTSNCSRNTVRIKPNTVPTKRPSKRFKIRFGELGSCGISALSTIDTLVLPTPLLTPTSL